MWTFEVVATMIAGAALLVAFVPWALRRNNIHPLVELRLLKNRTMTVALISMSLFGIAFFGASLLFPLYFQQVRGEDALGAGLLLAPQGLGAMLTMPIAGFLVDRIGPGKIVLTGISVITVGLGLFTMVEADTPYWRLLLALFVMGLGMGATMMPIMTAALSTLADHTIARGSTLLNIQQQVAASIGTALFAVVLTDQFAGNPVIGRIRELFNLTNGSEDPQVVGQAATQLGIDPAQVGPLTLEAQQGMAESFATVFGIATVLVALVLVPAFFLPRHKLERQLDPAVTAGH